MSGDIIFSGNGICVADGKGRFALPLDMRKAVKASSGENRLCLTIHTQLPCAIGFGLSHKQWLESQVLEMERAARDRGESFDAEAEREARFADMEDLNFDDGGRFIMPPDIRDMMGITDAIVFVGTSRHIQMWDPQSLLDSEGRSPRVRHAVQRFLAERAAGGGK
ncbi:MAG: division/cell wall cluster transcriptional repressor MraZ [Sphingobium sp.]|nr:division/cell wall cluster transcriptional repressor MraZ [Sphingobium sp.]